MDQQGSTGARSTVPYSLYDIQSGHARGVGGLNAESRGTALDNRDQTIAASFVATPSSAVLYDVRAQATRRRLTAPPMGRNSFRGFDARTVDLRLSRTLRADRWKVELIADAFNASLILGCVGCSSGNRQAPLPKVAGPTPFNLAVEGRANDSASVAAFGRRVAVVWRASTDSQSDVYISVST